jgi:antitoxin HicB
MNRFPYRVQTEWSEEDGVYVARVPAFEGLAAHGDTPEDATREARAAAEGMIASLRSHRRPVPPSDSTADYSGQLRLRIPRTVHARLSERASAEGVSLNTLMQSLLTEGLGSNRKFSPHAPREGAASDTERVRVTAKAGRSKHTFRGARAVRFAAKKK